MATIDDKICVSIGNVDFGMCLRLASELPLVEIRLDLLRLDAEKIDLLAMQSQCWIATCREGQYSLRERMVQLSAAMRSGATYVDIEYEASDEYREPLVKLARKLQCKIIISYHNFELTPDLSVLEDIIQQARDMGADLVKLTVTANTTDDCARIMSLYENHHDIVAFAMGEKGKITRIAAPILGANFTFASIDEEHVTAPGQLTISQMKIIYSALGS